MPPWKRNAYLAWVAVFTAAACWSMVIPFMPVFLAVDLGVREGVTAWAGLLGAVNSLGMALTAPLWGALGDRYGRKLMMLRAGAALTLSYLLMSTVTGPYALLAVRIMIGVLTGFIPTSLAMVGTTTPQQHVGQALALVSTAPPAGAIVGPLLGGLMSDLVGLRGAMVASAVLVGAATLMVLVFVREQFSPAPADQAPGVSGKRQARQHTVLPFLMITTTLAMAATTMLEPIIVPFSHRLLGPGTPGWMAGGLYAVLGLAFAIGAPLWAVRARRWGFAANVTLGLALGSVFTIAQAASATGWGFGGLRLAQGLAMAAVVPGISALIAQVIPMAVRGRAFGLNQSATSLGMALGPLTGGLLDTWAGTRWVFVANGLLMAGAALWTHLALRPRLRVRGG